MSPARTAEERTAALAVYADRGLAAAHHETGVPKSTLRDWARDAGLDLAAIAGRSAEQTAAATEASEVRCSELRVRLRELFLATAVGLLERVDAPHKEFKGNDAHEVEYESAPAGAARDYAVAAAICLDKYRLEVGEATSRDEHHVSDVRTRASGLLDELRDRREKSAS